MDKFDGVEVGQELIESELSSRPAEASEAADSSGKEKK